MRTPALIALLLLSPLRGCLAYEYDHEFWLRADGSGTVYVSGRPALWSAFKGPGLASPGAASLKEAARALFEKSGLRVRSVTMTSRGGRPVLFVAAEFDDVNRLSGTLAFPDLQLALRKEPGRLRLEGEWRRPQGAMPPAAEGEGLLAVRFHLPAKVYEHKNAADGVERGNIVSWRQAVSGGLAGHPLEIGAVMDERSILGSTVALFATAIGAALALLGAALWLTVRRGRREVKGPQRR